ncbi:hypothetical protein TSTA_003290 [Talaromyces stipitatus ATCC 10500]|uniref:Uncharacterized protein n=1 Tax=Talaromyces stipitatus (strain ATCC 10500 / CBS 375.48 / QM 6759 / NRRL 1006) TaxID=441959 RepID=B8MT86_TALSN|nr:uncharacterized protein TSTA_003290 [Talaromyces stipitatus ATCC 10500]EED12269.1 hypothetical protein TSTA_003290 [Talaromyces stipitatus ATCC 10500]
MASLATYSKNPPPVLVSSSLDGLEIGVPPSNHPSPYWREKPLPKTPSRPVSVYSTGDKTIGSTISLVDYTEKAAVNNNEILLAPTGRKITKSNTDTDTTSTRFYRRRNNVAHRNSLATRINDRTSIGFKTFLTEEQYGVGMHLARANHYFREKKWEIFPELGPQATSPTSTTRSPRKGRPRLPKGFSRQQMSKGEVFGINLKPRLVSKGSRLGSRKKSGAGDDEREESPRERAQLFRNDSSNSSLNDSDATLVDNAIEYTVEERSKKPSFATVRQRMRDMSRPFVSTRSELKEESIALWKSTSTTVLSIVSHAESKLTPTTTTAAIRARRSYSQPPPSQRIRPQISTSTDDISSATNPDPALVRMTAQKPILSIQTHFHTSPTSPGEEGAVPVISIPEYARHLRTKSKTKTKASLVLVAAAYNSAKQKIASAQAARRRAEMKKQIRLVGPIGQYPDGSINHWV